MKDHDVVVVGARCGGAPLAMLLARAGMRVLLIDKGTFPSDVINGNIIKPAGAMFLERWGLLDGLVEAGTPEIRDFGFEYVGVTPPMPAPGEPGAPPPLVGAPMIGPRRLLLDHLLVQAAVDAGVELMTRARITDLVWTDSAVTGVAGRVAGEPFERRARWVVGADGRWSSVAARAGATEYDVLPQSSVAYYGWWTGLPLQRAEFRMAPGLFCGAIPCSGGDNLVFIQAPVTRAASLRADPRGEYLTSLESFPTLQATVKRGNLVGQVRGMVDLPQFYRQAWGPGWALVGDAGHHKDPLVARGISDAFRDAEFLSRALVSGLGGGDIDSALSEYHSIRDRATHDVYHANARLARLDMAAPEALGLFGEVASAEAAEDEYVAALL